MKFPLKILSGKLFQPYTVRGKYENLKVFVRAKNGDKLWLCVCRVFLVANRLMNGVGDNPVLHLIRDSRKAERVIWRLYFIERHHTCRESLLLYLL